MNGFITRACAILAFCGVSFAAGWGFCSSHNSKLLADNERRLADKREQTAKVVDKIVTKYITKTIEVPVYVNPKDSDCSSLPAAWRLWHDAATGMPSSSGDSDAASVSIETASKTIGENYQGCAKNAALIEALQAERKAVSE